MAKFLVEGVLRIKMEVEADSEEEALLTAEETFDFETDVDSEVLPEFQVANPVNGNDLDDDADEVISTFGRSSDEDDDDN